MPIKAGQYDERVIIQNLTEGLDGFGDPTKSWADQVATWAQVLSLRGDEPFIRSQTLSKAAIKFRIRYNSGITITEAHRIVYDSVNYDIKHIAKKGHRSAEYWEIIAERTE